MAIIKRVVFSQIRRVNGILGLFVPSLLTPLQLLEQAKP